MRKVAWVVAVLGLFCGSAWAEICPKCRDKVFTQEVGVCRVCERETASGAFTLCPTCSKKLGQCESCRGSLAAAAEAKKADEAKNLAVERKAWLVENVKSFKLTLQYDGEQDPKAPLWSMTLSTHPIERLAIPVAHSDVVIDEKLAAKIIDWLEKDGFLARAEQNVRAEHLTPCYILQVAAGGRRFEENLGWRFETLARIDALAQALDGDARKAAEQVKVGLADALEKSRAADRVKKIKADLDNFEMSLYYSGPGRDKVLYSLTIATRVKEYGARAPYSLDAVVTKDEALKIVGWLEKDGFFAQAQEALDRKVAHPIYMLVVRGGGVSLGEDIGWGRPLLDRLDSLRDILNPDAADQLGKLMTAVKNALSAESAKAPAETPGAARAKTLKDGLDHFALRLQYQGPQDKPYYWLVLSTRSLDVKHKYQMELEAVIDKESASKLIDRLVESGALGRARAVNVSNPNRAARMNPAGPCYVLTVSAGDAVFEGDLGWGKDLAEQLLHLRAPLTGEAAKQMDVLIGRLSGYWKEWTGKPYQP